MWKEIQIKWIKNLLKNTISSPAGTDLIAWVGAWRQRNRITALSSISWNSLPRFRISVFETNSISTPAIHAFSDFSDSRFFIDEGAIKSCIDLFLPCSRTVPCIHKPWYSLRHLTAYWIILAEWTQILISECEHHSSIYSWIMKWIFLAWNVYFRK